MWVGAVKAGRQSTPICTSTFFLFSFKRFEETNEADFSLSMDSLNSNGTTKTRASTQDDVDDIDEI